MLRASLSTSGTLPSATMLEPAGMDLAGSGSTTVPAGYLRRLWLFMTVAPMLLMPAWQPLMALFGLDAVWGSPLLPLVAMLLALASISDVTRRRIPNALTYPALVWALMANAICGAGAAGSLTVCGPIGVEASLVGAGVCFCGMWVIYVAAGGGAGDVKLATCLGALLGMEQALRALVFAYVLAGVCIVAWAVWRTGPWLLAAALFRRVGSLLLPLWIMPPEGRQLVLLRTPVPLAAFFSAGVLLALWTRF